MDRQSKIQKTTQNPQLDRLSSLPDDILIDILSLLPNIKAASTSVLSTRWRFLWTHINSLDIDCRHFRRPTIYFYLAVCQLLLKLVPPSPRSFALHAPYDGQQHFEVWLDHLCSQNNVEQIKVTVEGQGYPFDETPLSSFPLPRCVFQTQSLVCLDLRCVWLDYELPPCDDDDVVVRLPKLKKLELRVRIPQFGFISKLVRSCPLLEDLSLSSAHRWDRMDLQNRDGKGIVIDISCANLKRLYLDLVLSSVDNKVVIDAPKLAWFGLFASFLTCCSFVRKPISLHEVHFGSCEPALAWSVLPAIMNARVLHLFGVTFDIFEDFRNNKCNSFIFRNLMELTLDLKLIEKFRHWDSIQFESTSSNLLLHVKKINVEIYDFKYLEELKTLTDYLLINAPALERLTFIADSTLKYFVKEMLKYKLREVMFCVGLYSWSRNATQCLTEFHGHYAKLPANIAEAQELENQITDMSAALGDDDFSS